MSVVENLNNWSLIDGKDFKKIIDDLEVLKLKIEDAALRKLGATECDKIIKKHPNNIFKVLCEMIDKI